ncbi:MAG TPA: hypothetical protein VFB68_06075 [Xanthobacteraceae bacterium]|nr:hypothetical protein [Xanthobacteraceae bacterium]
MLTEAALKSYLLDMPSGHIFDLTYVQLAGMFPPGATSADSRAKLDALAVACNCTVINNKAESRFELTRR